MKTYPRGTKLPLQKQFAKIQHFRTVEGMPVRTTARIVGVNKNLTLARVKIPGKK